jgi:hypothetical protein
MIVAWYDVKADKATLSENAQHGLATIRGLLEKRPEFANAYKTAKEAYESQGQSTGLQLIRPHRAGSSHGTITGTVVKCFGSRVMRP